MNESWIKIYRKFLEWEWYDDINTKVLFLHLLLKANNEEKEWHGVTIERGQYLTSLPNLSKETGLSIQNIRTSLSKLEQTQEIINNVTNKFRLITICKFDSYQSSESDANRQLTDKQQTKQQTINRQSNRQKEQAKVSNTDSYQSSESDANRQDNKQATDKVTPTKEYKDNNSLRSLSSSTLEGRESKFYQDLIPFVEIYGKEMIRAFFNYWSEPNKSNTKMRWELEKTWDVKRRLTTWSNRQKENHNGSYSNNNQKRSERLERQTELADAIARMQAEDDASPL